MDNLDIDKNPPSKDLNEPIPFDDSDTNGTSVSHSPLNLGGGNPASAAAGRPQTETSAQPGEAVAKEPAEKVASAERITAVKTFFTKLHPGAMEFLDEQITNWLKNNPDIAVKRTNAVTGMVQAKKTEPNIIITVWY